MASAQVSTALLNPQRITRQKPQIPDLSYGRACLEEGLTKLVFHPLEPTYQQALSWGGGIVLMKRQRAKGFQNVTWLSLSLSQDRKELLLREKTQLPVMATLNCQLDYVWNQLKPKLPGIPVRGFS